MPSFELQATGQLLQSSSSAFKSFEPLEQPRRTRFRRVLGYEQSFWLWEAQRLSYPLSSAAALEQLLHQTEYRACHEQARPPLDLQHHHLEQLWLQPRQLDQPEALPV